jgi:hypothetical protein
VCRVNQKGDKGQHEYEIVLIFKRESKGGTLVAMQRFSIFRLIPLVFILREAKRTSGGTRYKSLSLPCWRCRLKTCKTGFIFCDVFKLPGLSYYQNSSLELQPCVKILKISSPNGKHVDYSLETCRLFSQRTKQKQPYWQSRKVKYPGLRGCLTDC